MLVFKIQEFNDLAYVLNMQANLYMLEYLNDKKQDIKNFDINDEKHNTWKVIYENHALPLSAGFGVMPQICFWVI